MKESTNLITLFLKEPMNTSRGKNIEKQCHVFYTNCINDALRRVIQYSEYGKWFFCRDVFVVRLISADTVEEEMLALAQKKLELEKEVTGASTSESKEFSLI